MGRRDGAASSMLAVLLLVALAAVVHAKTPSLAAPIIGVPVFCNNEGDKVAVNKDVLMDCFSCICKNGLVECTGKPCPPTEGCFLLIPKNQSECCHQCKGCYYRGAYHKSHTEWTDPADPCRVLRCEAGIVTESDLQCYTPCRNPLPAAPGACCPTCPGCKINGQNVTQDRDVTIPEDPCVKCHCSGGRMTCLKKACPVLQCHGAHKHRPPGECCPQCAGSRSLIPAKGGCIVGDHFYKPDQKFNKDRCTECTCLNETAVCKRNACPVLECDPELQKTKPGDCCPRCPPVEESRTTCSFAGNTYQDGESWQLDPCKSCMCQRGELRCAMQRCPPLAPCSPGSHLVHTPGHCCSKCVENDGVCTVFGDPHYKTFDGKFFSFQGSCKYLLAADCATHTFSVRVTNDPRNTKYSAWTKTVSLKAGDLKVNLGQKMRVKVNGNRVALPYVLEGKVRVEPRNESVLVTTQVGVSILWDGYSFLEVSVSTAFKNKMCGLCGNYNSTAQDDLTTRRGRLVADNEVWRFATSWRVGGKKACGRQNEHLYKKPQCKLKANKTPCRHLKNSEQFGECDTKLNPNNYYEACIQDMCECPTGNCYCESLSAYAHECTRLGVSLPHWRRDTRCRGARSSISRSSSRSSSRNSNRQRVGPVRAAHRVQELLQLGGALRPSRPRAPPPSRLPIT